MVDTRVWDKPSVEGSRLNRISKPSINLSLLVRLSTRTCGTLLEPGGEAVGGIAIPSPLTAKIGQKSAKRK
jgi:hypothetical protein